MRKRHILIPTVALIALLSLAFVGVSEINNLYLDKRFIQSVELSPCVGGVQYAIWAPEYEYLSMTYSTRDESGHMVIKGINGLFGGILPLRYTAGNKNLSFEILTPMQRKIASGKLPLSFPEVAKVLPQKGAARKISDLELKANVNSVSYSFSAPGHTQAVLSFRSVMQKGKTVIQSDGEGQFSGEIHLPLAYASDLITVKIHSLKNNSLLGEKAVRLAFAEFTLNEPNPQGPLWGVKVCMDPGHQAQSANVKKVYHLPGSNQKVKGGSVGMAQGCVTLRKESVVALEISYRAAIKLQALGAEVIMTRTVEDTCVSNMERAEIANSNEADYFIRVHLNMFKNKNTHAVYVYCPRNSPYAKEAADKETYNLLAEALLEEYMLATGAAPGYTRFSDKFVGNNWAKMPAFLVETANMSTPSDDLLSSQPSYQEKMAEGIANGVLKMWQITQNAGRD